MRLFHCDDCHQPIFFENFVCLSCSAQLGFAPERVAVVALAPGARACANRASGTCNWLLEPDAPPDASLCRSCVLTRVIPDLSVAGHLAAWKKLEIAKRRLLHSLLTLGLPERGMAFEFLADQPEARVFTGHSDGVITVNVAEADDVERERRRVNLHEGYRTLLGHFRHESGHYYWNVLLENGPRLGEFRRLFGDETASYDEAVKRHYEQGAPAGWADRHISAYATMHPWEDFAETWAHVLHMRDALEMARSSGLALHGSHPRDPKLEPRPAGLRDFDEDVKDWFALTFLLNNLNRGLGLPDGYPFVLTDPVLEKLRFVYALIDEAKP